MERPIPAPEVEGVLRVAGGRPPPQAGVLAGQRGVLRLGWLHGDAGGAHLLLAAGRGGQEWHRLLQAVGTRHKARGGGATLGAALGAALHRGAHLDGVPPWVVQPGGGPRQQHPPALCVRAVELL